MFIGANDGREDRRTLGQGQARFSSMQSRRNLYFEVFRSPVPDL